MKSEYDVIVIGAGPAGSVAAREAAALGAETIVLEEHEQIGSPQHCSGLFYGTKSRINDAVLASMDPRVIIDEVKLRRIYSPKGNVFDIPMEGKGIYLVDRALFDLQLAGQAAAAGADILVQTKATDLVKEGDTVVGVKTNSTSVPEIRGKIVICSDGIQSLIGGMSVKSGLAEKVAAVTPGISMYLYNAKGIDRGVQELHIGAHGEKLGYIGWIWFHRVDQYTCYANFESMEAFQKVKQGNYILSEKLRDAVVCRKIRYTMPLFGGTLPQKTDNGIMLTGAAANYNMFVLAMLSGQYAGQVAGEAIKDGDFSQKRLSKYNEMCVGLDDPERGTKFWFDSFVGLTEDKQEEKFRQMTQAENVNFDVLEYI